VLKKRAIKWAALPLAASVMLFLSGCTQQEFERGLLPGVPGVTNHTDRIVGLWTTSWTVLWVVGAIAWALMIYAIIVYRRRKGDNHLPKQMRYNNPVETLFTVVPLIITIGFFAFTARDMAAIEKPVENPDVSIQVIGKQWSWDFNYQNENVYSSGIQSQFDGEEGSEAALPTLVLPVNKTTKIELTSRDVIHSFWVVEWLYKKDMMPGRTNVMYVTPQVEGTYKGKCAELCGEYHSMMLFNVKVVSEAEYETYITSLEAAGNVGQLDDTYNRNQNLPGDNPEIRG
jgi:cytochrome c oxidase subunit 2